MKIQFYKYQATGNDFILIDNRSRELTLTIPQIIQLCDRKFGIGADGLMLIENHPTLDFELVYYNSDGTQSLCGNGSRAATDFASYLGMVNGKSAFNAYDGPHEAETNADGVVRLRMNDVKGIQEHADGQILDTGSPHLIKFEKDVDTLDVFEQGRKIRYNDTFREKGINVNFVELRPDNAIFVRTYERGVENETLSCGTGVTAAALAASTHGYNSPISIKTRGGDLSVEFKIGQGGTFQDVFLVGPAKMVFTGTLEL